MSVAEEDLAAELAEPEPDWDAAVGEVAPIVPDGLPRANAFARRLLRLERRAEQVREAAAAEVRRVTAWRDRELAVLYREREWRERSLEAFARNYAAAEGIKTVHLSCGKVLRLSAPGAGEAVVVDEAAFLAWALSCDGCGHAPHPGEDCDAPARTTSPGPCGCPAYGARARGLTRQPPAPPRAPALAEVKKLARTGGAVVGEFVISGYVTADGEQVPGILHRVLAEDRFRVEDDRG